MGFNSGEDNSAALGRDRQRFKKPDSEVRARIAVVERRDVRGMKGDWPSGWRGLASLTSIGDSEWSIRKRGLDSSRWNSEVIEKGIS